MNAETGRLFGVRVVVWGAANGIGEAVARTCARHSANVAAVDGPTTDIDKRFNGVPQVKGLALPQGGAHADDVVSAAALELGGLDVVIVCGGVQPDKPIADAAAQERIVKARIGDLRRYFDAALPKLKRSPGGRFIAVGMLRSAFSRDAQILAEAAERSLSDLVREFAAGTGQLGITVNYVQPGAIMTPESRRVFVDDKDLRDFCIRHSAARRLGEPLDVARVALFLASDDANFVSGTGIAVDGGRAK